MFRRLADWKNYVLGDTYSAANEGLKGRTVKELAAERGTEPFDTLLDIVINDDLRTILWPIAPDGDAASWELRKTVWEDPRAMVGGSDAGAHLDRMCGAPYTTRFLGDTIRGRKLVPLEEAVRMITDQPAQLFGLRDRGRLAVGNHADVVVFDPETIGAGRGDARGRPSRRRGPADLDRRGDRARLRERRRDGHRQRVHRRDPGHDPALRPRHRDRLHQSERRRAHGCVWRRTTPKRGAGSSTPRAPADARRRAPRPPADSGPAGEPLATDVAIDRARRRADPAARSSRARTASRASPARCARPRGWPRAPRCPTTSRSCSCTRSTRTGSRGSGGSTRTTSTSTATASTSTPALPENPGYDQLAAALVPPTWDEETQQATSGTLLEFATRARVRRAAGRGVDGPVPAPDRRLLRRHASGLVAAHARDRSRASTLAGAERTAIIDLHTGLGPFGVGELIASHPDAGGQGPARRLVRRLHGAERRDVGVGRREW